MKWPLAFWLMLMSLCCSSQDIDSLTRLVASASSTEERIDLTNKLAFTYSSYSVDKSLTLANEAIRLSREIKYQKGLGDAYNVIGICHSIQGNTKDGLENFLTSLRIREKLDDRSAQAKVLNNIAGLYQYEQNFTKAIEYSYLSLSKLVEEKDSLAIGNAHLSLGLTFQAQKKYDSCIHHLNLASNVFEAIGANEKVAESSIYIAMQFIHEGEFAKALELASELEAQRLDRLTARVKADLLHVMGLSYYGLGRDQLALDYLRRALALARSSDYAEKLPQIVQSLSTSFENLHQLDSALHYFKLYAARNSEAISVQRARQTEVLERLYSTEVKDRALQNAQYRVERQNVFIWIVAGVGFVSLVTAFSAILIYRRKKRINEQLRKLNQDLLLREEEITRKSDELISLNLEMEKINQSLEQRVQERTAQIQQQNELLRSYAFVNAHHTRAPVARILGLVSLLKMKGHDDSREQLIELLDQTSRQLDAIVTEVNRKLEENREF